ncbi:hypothetical protein BSL78_21437 [Apostichopus japonicus]|uniref:Ig-like domain-containing protein n=1 Tax=Stichopus japonicus TaxID=307972 RepID=A0A2G8K134_STIJA|nr:hypothetical protein BSL78_21437 [Apostichopus japonicus]
MARIGDLIAVFVKVVFLYVIVSVETFEVTLGPSAAYKEYSEVVFPGERFGLVCLVQGVRMQDSYSLKISFGTKPVVVNGNLVAGRKFTGRPLPSDTQLGFGYEIMIYNVTENYSGNYKCEVTVGMNTNQAMYVLDVETVWPQCITHYNNTDDSFQLACFANIPQEIENHFTWEKINAGQEDTFVDFAVSGVNSGPKRVSYTKTNIKNGDTISDYKCTVVRPNLKPVRSCYFNLSTFLSASSDKPMTRFPVSSTTSSSTRMTSSTTNVTSPSTRVTTSEAEFTNDDLMTNNATATIVIVGLAIAVIIIICLIVVIFVMRKNYQKQREGNERSTRTDDVNNFYGTASSFTFANYIVDPDTQQGDQLSSMGDGYVSYNASGSSGEVANELYKTLDRKDESQKENLESKI